MPASSCHTHQLLRLHHPSPHSLKAPLASPCYDTDTSHAPYLSQSLVLSSRPSSISDTLKQTTQDAVASTSHSSAPSDLTHPQKSTSRLCGCRSPLGCSHQPTEVPQPITPINVDTKHKHSPQDSGTMPSISLTHIPNATNAIQCKRPSDSLVTLFQQSPVPGRQGQPSGNDLLPPQHPNQGMFYQAHNLSATGNFIDGNVGAVTLTNNFNNSNNFMKDLLNQAIPGAAANSSARDPPPRCHPGTRLAILERCLYFIAHCNGVKKMRWIVGAAGVGKSAVMQNVAESRELKVACNASVFFSINGRNDGTKAIMTLSYQFAAKSKVYRQVIEGQVADDPQVLQSSMSVQFEKFIIQAFHHNLHLGYGDRVLVIIDGLDECNDTRIQVELLRLISNSCISYPSLPIAWLVASRPESHIVAFFARPEVVPVYEKEEIPVDSDEARADVERYLRHELTEIGKASDFLGPRWPDEQDLWRLAKAAGGLFAYAHTAVSYIGDSNFGDPVSQLSDVLNVIDELPMADIPQEQHPMALLDALYARILSNIPHKIMRNARKLLLLLASNWDLALLYEDKNLIVMCNWLGMTANEAYAALNRLRSVLYFPQRHEARDRMLKPFHKSFIDYLTRSWFSTDFKFEAQQIKTQCAFRVLKQAPGAIGFGDVDYRFTYGLLIRNRNTCDNISITWRADEGIEWDNNTTRLNMYKLAIGEVVAGMKRSDPVFQSEPCITLLTTRFESYSLDNFPFQELHNFIFDKSRVREYMKHGMLKKIPTKNIPISEIRRYLDVRLQFHRPVATTLPDPWNSSFKHERVGQWERGEEQKWATVLGRDYCTFCIQRLKGQVEILIKRHPDCVAMVMLTSALQNCLELRFVDLEDDVSEWTYRVWIYLSPEERKKLGNTV